MQVMTVRVLFAERLSRDTDESTSIERQHAKLMSRLEADSREPVLAGVAEDVSVSGEVNMADRPKLGAWLTEEGRSRWDEIWVTTQDRLSRNDMHFMAFVFNILKWGKTLIVLDDPSLDLTTEEGRVMAHMKAVGPAKELKRIKERTRDSHAWLRNTPRWAGGLPHYCYSAKEVIYDDGDRGKHLVLEEYPLAVAHEMRSWIVDEGESMKGVAERLTARGEPTPKDLHRKRIKKKAKGAPWSIQTVKAVLQSEALLGVKMHHSKPIVTKDGSWFKIAEPAFDQDEWDTLQAAMKKRSFTKTRVNGASPLGGAVFCGKCGCSATQAIFQPRNICYRYYRCTGYRQEKRCQGVSMRAEDVEEIMEQKFLEECGDAYFKKRKFIPAEDHSKELTELKRRINRLREDRELGVYDNDSQYYADKMKEYAAREKELSELPQRESGWVSETTSVTYRQVWQDADQQARRKLLVEGGVRFTIFSKHEWNVYIPDDMLSRMVAV